MKKAVLETVLSQEIQRLQKESSSLDQQIRELESRRDSLRTLLEALEGLVNQIPIPRSRRTPIETMARPELKVGLPVRMLQGIYGGMEGAIGWCRPSPRGMICTLSLRHPDGRIRRTQVTERSLGEKWVLLQPDETTTPAPASPSVRKASSKTSGDGRRGNTRSSDGRARRPGSRKERNRYRAKRPEALLQRDTRVRVLTGKYSNWEGFISGIRDKGAAVTYALTLEGPDGEKGRTQVNHGSLGSSWIVLEGAASAPETPSSPTARVLRRRPPAETTSAEPEARSEEENRPSPSSGEEPATHPPTAIPEASARTWEASSPNEALTASPPAGGRYTPASPILPEKTPIRMLSGPYLGHTGLIVRVQKTQGPRPDAIYTVIINLDSDEAPVMSSIRHSSLGRSWTVVT